jgi:tetratricopeptide (TPR) repeat protein
MAIERASDSATDSPGDTMPPAMRRKLQQCYQHGCKLMEKDVYDYDYAHTMFAECIIRDPGNLVYVESFLTNLDRKYGGNKKGSRFPTLGGNKSALKKAAGKKNWEEVLKLGPDVLKSNPWDVPTLRAIAEACEAFDYKEVELRYLRMALDTNPKDPDVNRHCAQSLQRMGHFDQAIVCWHRVEEARKNDQEAPKMIALLQMEKTRAKAGFGPALAVGGSKPPQPKAAAAAKTTAVMPANATATTDSGRLELPEGERAAPAKPADSRMDGAADRRREVPLTPRQQLEQRLLEFPEDAAAALKLAHLHLEEERAADAERVLTKTLAASGNDLQVRERLEEVIVIKQRQRLQVAERLAEREKTDAATQLVTQLRQETTRAELDFYVVRSERYPQDLAIKHQLGLRLRRLGNLAEAAKVQLEAAQSGPHRASAYLELGECLQTLKQYPKAFEAYKRAIAAAAEGDHPDLRKLATYRAGILAAGLKEFAIAEKLFQELLELDPQYKDARDRLDKIAQIRHNG